MFIEHILLHTKDILGSMKYQWTRHKVPTFLEENEEGERGEEREKDKNIVLTVWAVQLQQSTDGLWLMMVTLLFQLYEWNPLSRNYTSDFGFGSFPGLAIRPTVFSRAAGLWQSASAPSRPCRRKGKQLIHLKLFCFSLSVHYPINYMRYSTPDHEISFLLDDFAQLQTNVRVLSLFKISQPKLWC